MKVLLIDNYDSFTYNIVQMINPKQCEMAIVRNDAKSFQQLVAMQPDGIILSPGPGGPEQAGICLELIGKLHAKVPILGICLGHQAIAHHFGYRVILAPQVVHGKSVLVHHGKQGLFQHMNNPFMAARYHSLIVEKPEFAAPLCIDAETSDGEIMALRHPEAPTYGLQFHPESILTENGASMIDSFLAICEAHHART